MFISGMVTIFFNAKSIQNNFLRYHLKFLKVNHRNLASTIFDHVSIDCFWYIVTLCYQTIQISVITVYSLAPFKGHWILGPLKQPFSNDSMLTFLAINGRGMSMWYQHYPFFNINCRHLKKGDLLEMWTMRNFPWKYFWFCSHWICCTKFSGSK